MCEGKGGHQLQEGPPPLLKILDPPLFRLLFFVRKKTFKVEQRSVAKTYLFIVKINSVQLKTSFGLNK